MCQIQHGKEDCMSLPKSRFRTIVAEVKLQNPRSLRYHEKMGFTETGRDNDYVYYKKEL